MFLKLQRVTFLASSLVISLSMAIAAVAQSIPPEGGTIPQEFPVSPVDPTPPDLPFPLPDEPPSAPPRPNLRAPSPSLIPGCPPSPDDSERFFVREIVVSGNTVLQEQIERLSRPLKRRSVTFEDLVCLRSKITELYVNHGYITSGAFLPNNQDLSSGVVQIQVVEGELEQIEISGLNRLRKGYVRSRLRMAATTPVRQQRLEKALQLLQLNPLIAQVNAELTAGSAPGRNLLLVEIQEAPAFNAAIATDNYRSPSIGSQQGNLVAAHENLLGFGDRLSAAYGVTQGLDLYEIDYAIPINPADGRLSFGYSNSDTRIVEDEFEDFEIESETETFSLNLRQPIFREPEREIALGLSLDVRRRQTFLLDEPFSFSVAAEDGETRVTVLRFFQDYVERGSTRVLAVRSQFSIGLDALYATINDIGTDGRFIAWQGQFQWVQRVSSRALLITKIGVQLTPDSLLSLEQISLGGVDTVRGYRENQIVTDNGVLGTLELRLPLTANSDALQLAPFIDVGTGWNDQAPDPETETLLSTGVGLRWLVTPNLSLRLDYGIPLISVDDGGDSLQENGLHFSVRYQPF